MKDIVEGETRLLIPEKAVKEDPKVFFNPRMKLNRDLCVLLVRSLREREEIVFLDLLAGTGAKGLRIALETGCRVILNDGSKDACRLMRRNAELNHLDVEVCNKSANLVLQERRDFNFIDIDPFGTPVPFLDNSFLALGRRGYLGVTATDTAPLCGVYPGACWRKYGAVSLKTDFCHELGIRILAGYVARTAAKYGKGVRFLLSHYREHYFRVYAECESGRKKADMALAEMGYLYYCSRCLDRQVEKSLFPSRNGCSCGGIYKVAGPLWLGDLMDKQLIEVLIREAREMKDSEALRTLLLIRDELEVPFYYDLHKVCKSLKVEVPPMRKFLEELRSMGFRATRTHFSPTAVKTDAGAGVLRSLLRTSFQ